MDKESKKKESEEFFKQSLANFNLTKDRTIRMLTEIAEQKNKLEEQLKSLNILENDIKVRHKESKDRLKEIKDVFFEEKINEFGFNQSVEFIELDIAYKTPPKPALKKGDAIVFKWAPDNPHDPNAIEIHRDGVHIGFVARVSQKIIDKKKEEGWKPTLSGFVNKTRSGEWNKGTCLMRVTNPVLAWDGYNPTITHKENLSKFEALLLSKVFKKENLPEVEEGQAQNQKMVKRL